MTVTTDLISQFLSARRVSTPLLAVWTADPAATIEGLVAAVEGDDKARAERAREDRTAPKPVPAPCLQWDLMRGLTPLNALGQAALKRLIPEAAEAAASARDKAGADKAFAAAVLAVTGQPTDALRLLADAPDGTVAFMLNLSTFWDPEKGPDVAQGVWNLRDPFKATKRQLVVVASGGRVPDMLEHDVTVFSEPLPTRAELGVIADQIHTAIGMAPLAALERERALDAMTGLSAFAAEQVYAMSISKAGLDLATLRARRAMAVNNVRGLTISDCADAALDDLGGLGQIKAYFRHVAKAARTRIRLVVLVDELDKAMGGAGVAGGPGDNTGIAQDAHRVLLVELQASRARGAMFYGVPGAGKTAIAKAIANMLGCELIEWDMAAMQDSAAGASQRNIRTAMKVVKGVSGGEPGAVLWIATCNGTATISTELRRRFNSEGEWFFDLPARDETPRIVAVYSRRYGVPVTKANPLPDVSEWTGAEIDRLFYRAWDLGITLDESARFVVPMKVAAAEKVAELRRQAEGRYLSVSSEGYYSQQENAAARPRRQITLDDVVTATVAGTVIGNELREMKES